MFAEVQQRNRNRLTSPVLFEFFRFKSVNELSEFLLDTCRANVTDAMYHPCKLIIYGKLLFTLVVEITDITAADPGFSRGAPTQKEGTNLLFGQNFLKTASKWGKVHRERGCFQNFTMFIRHCMLLDNLTMQSHSTTCVIFFFIDQCEVNEIPKNLQKIESANSGKNSITKIVVVADFGLKVTVMSWKALSLYENINTNLMM